MKMVKKVLFGLVVLGTVLALTGCGKTPPKDDTENAITAGLNNNWKVNYENKSETDLYRAYEKVATKHAGTLVRVQFDDIEALSDKSKMGLIFNQHYVDEKDTDKGQNFFIIGIAPSGAYYVSEYTNVTEIQGDNFGVKTDSVAKEKEIVPLKKANGTYNTFGTFNTNYAEGKKTVWIWYQAKADGTFDWAICNNLTKDVEEKYKTTQKAAEAGLPEGATPLVGGTTNTKILTPSDKPASVDKEIENGVSVYAQIQPSSTLKGEWKFVGFFKEAEDAE